jgi:hypothetical protein
MAIHGTRTLSQEQNLPGVFEACTPGLAQAASLGKWPSFYGFHGHPIHFHYAILV